MTRPPRTSRSKQLADAIANTIASEFARPVKSLMGPQIELRKVAGLEIQVWPLDRTVELLNRNRTSQVEYEIAVAVLDRVGPDDDEDLRSDELLALIEHVGDTLLSREIQNAAGTATVTGYTHAPLYDRELLESRRLFAAALTLTLTRVEG